MAKNEFIELKTAPPEEEAIFAELDNKRAEYVANFPGQEEEKSHEFEKILAYLLALKTERDLAAKNPNFSAYNVPTRTIDSDECDTVVERLRQAERGYSPDLTKVGYLLGTATKADEVRIPVSSESPGTVFTAEHATTHKMGRESLDPNRKPKEADWGVGALAEVLASDSSGLALTMPGRQTGNGNGDPDHPFKHALRDTISDRDTLVASLQLHGAAWGKVRYLSDLQAMDVLLGLGSEPNEATVKAAELMRDIGKELGLRVGINEKFALFDEITLPSGLKVVSPRPRKSGDPGIAHDNFNAGPQTTRQVAAEAFSSAGRVGAVSLQVEIASPYRTLPSDAEGYSDVTRKIGPYIAYLLVRSTLNELEKGKK